MYYNFFGIKVYYNNYNNLIAKISIDEIKTIDCLNQDFANIAYKNKRFRELLNKIDLIHTDGIGILIGLKILYGNFVIKERINSPDLTYLLLDRIDNENGTIYLLGGTEEVVQKAKYEIGKKYRHIHVAGYHNGYFELDNQEIIEKINKLNPEYLFVGIGTIRQEEWALAWKNDLKVKKIIIIGGGIRVLANDRIRGPKLIQRSGLEWLVRILNEPTKYWKRYLIGIPLFIARILKYKLSKHN
jgi:exopolysaccharide biosynthesis WecB/TagA/CpsF family protein